MRIGGVTGWKRSARYRVTFIRKCPPTFCGQANLLTESNRATGGLPLIAEPFEIKAGNIFVPDRSGNGINWNDAAVKRYAI